MLVINGEEVEERAYINLFRSNVVSCVANGPVITRLDLTTNELETFDASDLPELVDINVSYNRLKSFVLDENSKTTKLTNIQLDNNQIDTFACKPLPELETLDLTSNRLTSFTEKEGSHPKLQYLAIGNNLLTSFVVGNYLFGVWHLDLSFNRLTSFSMETEVLPNLKWLILDGNPLRTLILTRAQVPKITYLGLGDTNVEFVDESLVDVVEEKKVQVRAHGLGTKGMIHEAFGIMNPLIDEICEHIHV